MTTANIRDDDLRNYLKSFHETLQSTADQYLQPEYHKRLLHLSCLPATIKGYVSTQFGIAIEYIPSGSTLIEIITGSQRAEDLLFNAPKRIRNIGPQFNIGGAMCSFTNLHLEGAFPFRLTKETASISLFDMSFEVGPWKHTVHYAQIFGCRKADNWTVARAVARAKDEVLAALVEIQQADRSGVSLDQYIATHKARTVLVLGDYSAEGLVRLDAIIIELKSLGYEPIMIKDIPDHPHQDVSQKVVAIGAIARFVVVDDSSKSGHLMEFPICKQNNWVTILMRLDGIGGSWMTAGASNFSNVILELQYDRKGIRDALMEGTKWAEEKISTLEQKLSSVYPWRHNVS